MVKIILASANGEQRVWYAVALLSPGTSSLDFLADQVIACINDSPKCNLLCDGEGVCMYDSGSMTEANVLWSPGNENHRGLFPDETKIADSNLRAVLGLTSKRGGKDVLQVTFV